MTGPSTQVTSHQAPPPPRGNFPTMASTITARSIRGWLALSWPAAGRHRRRAQGCIARSDLINTIGFVRSRLWHSLRATPRETDSRRAGYSVPGAPVLEVRTRPHSGSFCSGACSTLPRTIINPTPQGGFPSFADLNVSGSDRLDGPPIAACGSSSLPNPGRCSHAGGTRPAPFRVVRVICGTSP